MNVRVNPTRDRTAGPRKHLLTVDEFLTLDRAGMFDDIGRVELVEGEIYVMSPLHRPHGSALAEITIAVGNALRSVQSALRVFSPTSAHLDDHNLPEADLMVATVEPGDFIGRGSARLAIEVSSSSLRYDLGKKARLYARTGIPEYWVIDVKKRVIICMSGPSGDAYLRREEFAFGAAIPSATIESLVVDTTYLA